MLEEITCPKCDKVEWRWPYLLAQAKASCEYRGVNWPEWHEIICEKCNHKFKVKEHIVYEIAEH